jgi:antitoxin ParD1/3/4
MAASVRKAVETGEYASSSEVVRDALHEWTRMRDLRQQSLVELRTLWRQAVEEKTQAAPADEMLDRLENKYQALADAAR